MKKTPKPPSEAYQNFEKLAKQLISVPKSEIEKRQAEYEKKKAAKKRKLREMAESTSFAFSHGFSVGDEILRAIGLTAVCQSQIEIQLSLSIHELTDMDYQKGCAVTAGMSFRSLCTALSSLVLQVLEETDERYIRFTDLMGKLQHFEEFRNQVMHSIWAHGEEFKPDRSLRIKTTARQGKGVKHQLEEVEIAKISTEIKTANLAIAHLSILVAEVAGKPIGVIDDSARLSIRDRKRRRRNAARSKREIVVNNPL